MKVRMQDIIDRKEKIVIPLYFAGDETDEFVELDVDSIYNEFEKIIQDMEVKG